MGRGRPVGCFGEVPQGEIEVCLGCTLPDCRWPDQQKARSFLRAYGEAPCEYWRLRWERTGTLERWRLRGRAEGVVAGFEQGLEGQVRRAVAAVNHG